MAKPSRNDKPGSDLATGAPATAEPASAAAPAAEPVIKNPAAVLLGRLGGLKGGPARARKLTPQQRSAIARKAALARWSR